MPRGTLSLLSPSADDVVGAALYGAVGVVIAGVTAALRRSESSARAKSRELETVLDATPFMLTRCSRDHCYLFVSRAYAAMLGRIPAEMVGRPVSEFIRDEGFAQMRPHVAKVLAGQVVEYETDVDFRGVGARRLQVTYTPETDANGETSGWIASVLDVTETRRATAEREALLAA